MNHRSIAIILSFVVGVVAIPCCARAQEFQLHQFERQQLTDTYFSEGANFGDLNHDGKPDAIHGPYWWEGPEFKTRREIYPPKPQNVNGYSNNFFTWVYDFTGDGWSDLVSIGLPGSPAILYINPGAGKVLDATSHWQTQKVFEGVGNESPLFVNLVGDAAPELVCNFQSKLGYATPSVAKLWNWTPISADVGEYPFMHGLGVGDVNADGLQDVIFKGGWYEQPKTGPAESVWKLHPRLYQG